MGLIMIVSFLFISINFNHLNFGNKICQFHSIKSNSLSLHLSAVILSLCHLMSVWLKVLSSNSGTFLPDTEIPSFYFLFT
jgi:hypothetical protein